MIDSIYGKPLDVWLRDYPLLRPLMALEPVEWFNPGVAPLAEASGDIALDAVCIADASTRLQRFAPLLAQCFADVHLDDEVMCDATPIIWATGGGMVPEAEMSGYLESGRQALAGS
ncbi:hypothetical protein [Paraburkholderia heleia]|uniref:hypothetical protein n=1 Tax=Paraburkholderia heleia TaxID=634127 RepID=UPI002AB70037|nr:hypothetical protein [Paraburkholderia heleia]